MCVCVCVCVLPEPYVLIMEFVSYGTLRRFLQTHKDDLTSDPELQSLLTIASYHIALAMEHLRSKMVPSFLLLPLIPYDTKLPLAFNCSWTSQSVRNCSGVCVPGGAL